MCEAKLSIVRYNVVYFFKLKFGGSYFYYLSENGLNYFFFKKISSIYKSRLDHRRRNDLIWDATSWKTIKLKF